MSSNVEDSYPKIDDLDKYEESLEQCAKNVQHYGQTLLGGINHICTNDFRNPTGAIVWTSHGIKHSEGIIEKLNQLIKLPSIKELELNEKERCALFCAAWMHDVGMFLRHPDFPDLYIQRKYHGRIARLALSHMSDPPEIANDDPDFINLIAEICELHQSKTGIIRTTQNHATELGNLLLMADALDIGQHRTCKASDNGAIVEMIRNTTTISPESTIEWWLNDCIKKTNLEINENKELIITCIVDKDKLADWKQHGTDDFVQRNSTSSSSTSDLSENDKKVLLSYMALALRRYIIGDHLFKILDRRKGEKIFNYSDIKIFLKIDNVRHNVEDLIEDVNDLNYDSVKPLWAEQLSCYDFGKTKHNMLRDLKNKLEADSIYLFVFDGITNTIRYLYNQTIIDLNNSQSNKPVNKPLLERQRIPFKSGIIGHVMYCGIEHVVPDLNNDPRRCLAPEDKLLQLHSVLFYPLIKYSDLWAVIMLNRTEDSNKFEPSDLTKIKTFFNNENNKTDEIVNWLEDYSQPYSA